MTVWLIKIVVAYLLGSVSGSLFLGRLRKVDIRQLGSGNAGGTNAFRTQGLMFALGVVLIDVGKAVIAVAVVPGLDPAINVAGFNPAHLPLYCGLAAIVGHCYPVFHGFRGGKGAATVVGTLVVLGPALLMPMLLVWVLVLVSTGYVGLATIVAGLSLIPAALIQNVATGLIVFCTVVALFMVFTHRANLKRLWSGQENRFERARIINWLRR